MLFEAILAFKRLPTLITFSNRGIRMRFCMSIQCAHAQICTFADLAHKIRRFVIMYLSFVYPQHIFVWKFRIASIAF